MTMTLFGNWVFADIVKMRSYRIRTDPTSNNLYLNRERKRFRNRHTATKEDGHVKKEAEIGVTSQAQGIHKECQRPAEAEKGKKRFYPGTFGENMALSTS